MLSARPSIHMSSQGSTWDKETLHTFYSFQYEYTNITESKKNVSSSAPSPRPHGYKRAVDAIRKEVVTGGSRIGMEPHPVRF